LQLKKKIIPKTPISILKKLVTTVLAFWITFTLYAQDTVYFSKPSSSPYSKKTKRSSEKNILKIAPLSFISGYIPLYFEREITPFFSLQAGIGITTKNYLKQWANNLDFSKNITTQNTWNTPGNEGNENYYNGNDYTHRSSSIGYYFSIQPRIYFENEGMDGAFFGISYDRFRYNTFSDKIVNGSMGQDGNPVFSNERYKEYENISDISAIFGTQTLYEHIALEYSLGIALRNVSSRQYAYTYDNSTGKYIDGYSDQKKTTPAITISIKVGYHY
jgi:hypothetical protein